MRKLDMAPGFGERLSDPAPKGLGPHSLRDSTQRQVRRRRSRCSPGRVLLGPPKCGLVEAWTTREPHSVNRSKKEETSRPSVYKLTATEALTYVSILDPRENLLELGSGAKNTALISTGPASNFGTPPSAPTCCRLEPNTLHSA